MKVFTKTVDETEMICIKSPQMCGDDGFQYELYLDLKEALDMSMEIKALVDKIIEESASVVIVPKAVKTMIECGKVARLGYNHMQHNYDSDMELYSILVTFMDGSQRHYFHECKFSADENVFKAQMNYVHNMPIYVDCDEGCPNLEIDSTGRKGYNITSPDDPDSYERLQISMRTVEVPFGGIKGGEACNTEQQTDTKSN